METARLLIETGSLLMTLYSQERLRKKQSVIWKDTMIVEKNTAIMFRNQDRHLDMKQQLNIQNQRYKAPLV